MRDAIEKLVGGAVATDLLKGGNSCGTLAIDESETFLVVLPPLNVHR
jgi:hypothetical protein